MKRLQTIVFALLIQALYGNSGFTQQKTRVYIRIIESDTRRITPAMVCITNLKTSKVHLPPYGVVAGEPTYPNLFLKE